MPPYGGIQTGPPIVTGGQNPYPASIAQSGQNYDELMNRYRSLLTEPGGGNALMNQYSNLGPVSPTTSTFKPTDVPNFAPLQYQSYTPQNIGYTRSGDVTGAMAGLADLARTGGYTQQGIADLRARGISPIRAVYANAQQNINRQRALQGGYSPNYTAATAKMSREMADQISSATQNVNAGIAERVAQGRLSAAPQYAGAAQREQDLVNQINIENARRQSQAEEFNRQQALSTDVEARNRAATIADIQQRNQAGQLSTDEANRRAQEQAFNERLAATQAATQFQQSEAKRKQDIIDSMRQLYGTTPAQPALYGQQAIQKAQLREQQRSRQQSGGGALINAYLGGARTPGIMPGGSFAGARF